MDRSAQQLIKPKGPNDAVWKGIEATVRQVYWVDDETLERTIGIVRAKHNFSATKKQWLSKLDQWNLKKNVSGREMHHVIRIQRKRKAEDEKETRFTVRDRPVPRENIDRWLKRQDAAGENTAEPRSQTCKSRTSSGSSWACSNTTTELGGARKDNSRLVIPY